MKKQKLLIVGAIFIVLIFFSNTVSAEIQDRTTDHLFDFEAYGDTRTGHLVHQQIVDQMVPLNSDFVLHVGDLVNSGDSMSNWDTFLSITSGYRDKAIKNGLERNFYPSIGNHDLPLTNYDSIFGIDHYYSFDYKGFHFIALNTSESYISGSDQYNWLVNDLVANEDEEIIVFFHYPAYSSGPHGGTADVVTYLSPLFESAGVKLVLTGHSHIYERTYPIFQNAVNSVNGVTYIITGGGGAPLGSFTTGNWWTAAGESSYEFVYLQVTNSKIYANVLDQNGNNIDSFEIINTKNQKYLMTSLEDNVRKNIKKYSVSGSLNDDGFKPNSNKANNQEVRIASGDVNLDGKDELIVGAGPGGKPWVKIFETDGTLLKKFYAFKKSYSGGIDVAAGDINSDGIAEIAASRFSGEESRVKIFNYLDNDVYFDRIIFPKLKTSASISMGDVDMDYNDELIVGTGANVRSKVRFYDILTTDKKGTRLGVELKPFDDDIKNGIDVANGDTDGDGFVEIGVSKLSGDKGRIKILEYDIAGTVLEKISVFRESHKSGANIEMFDIDSDGKTEIISSARKADDSLPRVKIFKPDGEKYADSFYPYKKSLKGGVVVAGINE